jgi:hypothetical protein
MRTISILTAIFLTQLFPANASFAAAYDDCKASCVADITSRIADCPSPSDSANYSEDHEQCLKTSQELYSSCIESCPPPPPPPESDSDNNSPTVSY